MHRTFERLSIISLVVALAIPSAATAQTNAGDLGRATQFAIPAGDLRAGLSLFSQTSGVQIVIPPAAAGRRTHGVSGMHTAQDALSILLRGTGLTSVVSGGVVVLKPGAPVRRTPRRGDIASIAPMAIEQAADGSEGQPGDIIVSGYRQSLKAAQDYKRRAVGSEDDIVAQDIAAFPDLNLAESLQRIPGITITRDAGEGRQITLRGLGPDFTRTQLDGMEVLGNTASGMDNRGGVSRTRSFDFSLFASELFNRVSVQKSYAADQDEGGIAGTVQLYTAKPFDYDGAKFVISAKGQTNTNTSGVTPRIVALASQRQGDFGALVSLAYSEIKSNEYGYRNWGWSKVTYQPKNVSAAIDPTTAGLLESGTIFAPQAESPSSWFTDRRRLGVTTALQYHPGTRFKLDVDLLYGRLWDARDNYAIASGGFNPLTGNVSGTQVIQSATIQGNSLLAGSYTGIDERSEHNVEQNHTDFYQGVSNATWDVSDRFKVTALGGYERSAFKQPVFDKVFLEAKNEGFSFDDRPTIPVNTYGFNPADPNSWNLQRLDTQENAITSTYVNGKLDGDYKLSDTSSFEAGGEYKHFTNGGYQYNNKVFHGTAAADTPIPNSLKNVTTNDSLIPYIVGNIDGIYALIGDPRDLGPQYLTAGSNYQVEERTWSGFGQYDLDTHAFGMRLRANAGVRYYSTDLISSGSLATVVNGVTVLQPVSIQTNSHGFLPAANLALSITPSLIARLSANRNVNRPALSDLAAAGTLTTAPFGGSVSVGNPYLTPYMATSVEGGLEYYMGKSGFASLGFFYKNMDHFITSATSQVPYSATGFPLSLLLPGQGGDTPYNYTRPINGDGADIKGIEAAVQHDFTFLPAPFDHLGIVANGTFFDGHQNAVYNGVSVRIPLYNLSKWAANATLYYDTDRWGARISTAYRSRYITSAGSNGNIGDGIRATNNVDFQARYNLTPRLKLVVEGINITDQPIEQFTDLTANRTEVYTTSGRTFTFGVTAEF